MAVLETPARIEPCALETFPAPLADLISGIAAAASTLGNRLHPRTAGSLASLVRVMNCYYSNLIEGTIRAREISNVRCSMISRHRRSVATCSWRLVLTCVSNSGSAR